MRPSGGVYSALLGFPVEQVTDINKNAKVNVTLAYTVLGESFTLGPQEFPANPADLEFGKKFWQLSGELLAAGKIRVHKPAVNKFGTGLEGVLKGLEALKEGKVSGEKLVFTL